MRPRWANVLSIGGVIGLGLVTNIAVAWACHLYSPVATGRGYFLEDSGLLVSHEGGYGRDQYMQTVVQHGKPSDAAAIASIDRLPVPLGTSRAELACSRSWVHWQVAGIPLRCLQMKSVSGNPSYRARPLDKGVLLIRNHQPGSGVYSSGGRVPVRPVWLGLAADTLLWSAPWLLLLLVIRRLRRLLRVWTEEASSEQ